MPSFSRSRFAARLQNAVSHRREEAGLYDEIAEQLPLGETGRLLDIGTGSGLQLRVIHRLCSGIELYGLDVSAAAIRIARENLGDIAVDLQVGSIESAPYDDGTFDVVMCSNSLSYWQGPVACLNEIHRILRPGGTAMLFEPQQDVDIDQVVETIHANLADKSPLRRFLAASLNRFGLRWGHLLGLKLYTSAELAEMASRSRFGDRSAVGRVTLQNLPIFVRITCTKPAAGQGVPHGERDEGGQENAAP